MKQRDPYQKTLSACYAGLVSQAVVNNLAPLLFIVFQDEFGLSYEMLGRLILLNFGTQIAADVLTLKFVDRIGHRRAVVAAHVLCAAGLACLGLLPRLLPEPFAALAIAVVLYAAGGGIIEVMISPIVDSLPGDAKASAMSLLHSFYCWGQMGVVILTTLLLRVFGAGLWPLLPALWASVPAANAVRFLRVPLMPPVPEAEKTPLRRLLGSKPFLLALALMLCAGSSELTMSQWSSLFAQKALQVPKVLGDLLGPCLFAALMGFGRMACGIWGRRINLGRALAASAALCLACYAAAVFLGLPAVSLAGCALCGLSVSLMWPGTLSMTAAAYPKGGTAMFGALAVFGDIGCSAGPWLTGLVSELARKSGGIAAMGAAQGMDADQIGLRTGLLAGALFPALLLAGLLMFNRMKSGKRSKSMD